METLSNEVPPRLYYPLSVGEIEWLCIINQTVTSICQSDAFWAGYLEYNYSITQVPPGRTSRQTAVYVDSLLKRMFARQLYPVARSIRYIVYLPEDKLLHTIDDMTPQQLVSTGDLSGYVYPEDRPRVVGPIDFPISKGSYAPSGEYVGNLATHQVYNAYELDTLSVIMKAVTQSTKYYTPIGLISVPLDVDKVDLVFTERYLASDADEHFNERMVDSLEVYAGLIFAQYVWPHRLRQQWCS